MRHLIILTALILLTLSARSQGIAISNNINYTPAYTLDLDGILRINSLSTGVLLSNSIGVVSSANGLAGQVLGSGPTWIDPKTFSWTIGGNDNTVPGLNFIGTTNNVGLAFRTNGVEHMRLQSTGQLTIGSTQAGGKLDVHQSAGNDVARFTTYGHPNTILLRRTQVSGGSLTATASATTVLGRFDFQGYTGSSYVAAARIEATLDAAGGTSSDMPGRLSFSTTADGTGTLSERMAILNSGTVRLNSYTTNGILRTSGGTGTLAAGGLVTVAEGGTGVGTLTGVVIGNGTGAMTAVSGTGGQFLRRNAANTGYEFATLTLTNGTVTSISTGAGLTGGPITTSGTIGLGGQALAFHNLSSNGMVVRTGAGAVAARTLASGAGISVTNGDGVAADPVIALTNVGTPGTYNVVTVDEQGRVTAGTNPTTLAGHGITNGVTTARTLTLTGVANQTSVVGGTQSLAGNRTWTIGTVQDIATTSNPTFNSVTAPNDFIGNLRIRDTRSDNFAPNTYDNEASFEFKDVSAVGSPGSGYGGMITLAPWSDNSGNSHHQLFFNDQGIYYRTALPDAASWNAWSQILTSTNTPNLSGTPGYLARWTGTNTLGIGIVQDNGARVGIGTAPHASYTVQSAGDILLTSGWLRTTGSTGWYNETHGGGWFMQDATWIRSYNNKNVYINTFLRADGGISSGTVGSSGDGTIRATSFITSDVGYRISNTAANGTYLRGNGTNYVSSAIQPGDIPAGSGNYIQNQTASSQAGAGFWTAGTGRADAFGVSNTGSTTGKGISLYNGPTAGEPTYGLMFAGTGTFGTHGYVSADWATYLTMNTTANRGWVFRAGVANVASINNAGSMSINGRLRLGNAANTEFYSDGNRLFARAEGADNVAQFAAYGMYLPRTGQTYNLYLGEGLQIGYNTANPILSYRSGDLLFRSDATERMRLTAAGNLGIGTAGPTQALDVRGNVYTTGQHFLQNTSPTIYLQDTDHRSGMIHMNSNLMYFLSGNAVNSTTWATNNSEWPMTINMTNDAVSVGGVMSVGDWGGCGSDYRIRIGEYSGCEPLIQPGVTGWGYVGTPTLAFYRMYSVRSYTSDGFWSFSDERLKTNVKPIENPLNKIMSLEGVTYDNREGSKIYDQREPANNIEKYGFIAQNVMNVMPSAVAPIDMTESTSQGSSIGSNHTETYLGVNYGSIIPLLVEAVKEQQRLIDQLKAEVSVLKMEINRK